MSDWVQVSLVWAVVVLFVALSLTAWVGVVQRSFYKKDYCERYDTVRVVQVKCSLLEKR